MTDPTTTQNLDPTTPPTTPAAPADSPAEPGVGFVGCSRARSVLRVRVTNLDRHRMRVECPNGCGQHMTPDPFGRPLRPDEPEPELVELPDPSPVRERGRERSREHPDAEILAAIPEEWTPAADIAAELGYTNGNSFTNRLREMRQRAEAKGAPLPIESARSKTRPGGPLMLRRA